MDKETTALLDLVREHYTNSSDFNGLPIPLNRAIADEMIISLIGSGDIDLVRGDGHPNPHIKAFPAEPIDVQIQKIRESGLIGCLYPTQKHLIEHRAGDGETGPFTRELKLGAPQLDYRVFDLRILEWYRNDPRYYFQVDEIHGTIYQRSGTEGPDRRVLQDNLEFFEFGFAYNEKLERAVAAFLRYLHDLPPDQQAHLAQYQLEGDYQLHPDFYRTQIIGDFPERISIYDAFLEEKRIINEMSKLMGKQQLFRSNGKPYERPSGFGILLRPTKKEYHEFTLLLDKLLSDDINRRFFQGDIPVTEKLTREDGTSVTHSVGTITLLETWLNKYFRTKEPEIISELIANLRAVRAERQKPAHKVDDNEFDQKYIVAQRELIIKGFDAVRTIRMALENHPKVAGYEVPDWLREGRVWTI